MDTNHIDNVAFAHRGALSTRFKYHTAESCLFLCSLTNSPFPYYPPPLTLSLPFSTHPLGIPRHCLESVKKVHILVLSILLVDFPSTVHRGSVHASVRTRTTRPGPTQPGPVQCQRLREVIVHGLFRPVALAVLVDAHRKLMGTGVMSIRRQEIQHAQRQTGETTREIRVETRRERIEQRVRTGQEFRFRRCRAGTSLVRTVAVTASVRVASGMVQRHVLVRAVLLVLVVVVHAHLEQLDRGPTDAVLA